MTFSYDAAGDRVSMTDGVGGTSWAYDDPHRATSVTDPFAGVVGYTYDAAGNRRTLTYPDTRQVQYAYEVASIAESVDLPTQPFMLATETIIPHYLSTCPRRQSPPANLRIPQLLRRLSHAELRMHGTWA